MQQGYVEGTFDLVVAFFVIHATTDLQQTLHNIRRLLRPGGFMVVGEGQEGLNSVASSGFIFGTLLVQTRLDAHTHPMSHLKNGTVSFVLRDSPAQMLAFHNVGETLSMYTIS